MHVYTVRRNTAVCPLYQLFKTLHKNLTYNTNEYLCLITDLLNNNLWNILINNIDYFLLGWILN